jgi:uncharacterized phage protein gp47/JayE
MTAAYAVPNLEALVQTLKTVARNGMPDLDVARGSDADFWIRAFAQGLLGLYAQGRALERQMLPDTATGLFLERHAAPYQIKKRPAVGASGVDALRVRGVPGATFDADLELRSNRGLRYRTDEGGTLPPAAFLDVDVSAIDTGTSTSLAAGEHLTFVSQPVGIQPVADVVADLDGGEDTESDDQLRARLFDRTRHPASGGNPADYRRWVLSVPGVQSVQVFPRRRGLGTVDVSILVEGTGAGRLPTAALQAAVFDAIEAERPTTAKDHQVVAPAVVIQPVDVRVTPAPGWDFDWTGTLTVQPGATDSVLPLDATAPVSLGDRILVAGEERAVASIDATAAQLTLDAPLSAPPAPGTVVHPGGPLVAPVQDAVRAHFDRLLVQDTLYVSTLECAVSDVPGVVDRDLVTPSANVVPPPPVTVVQLLVPGPITVRHLET